MLKNSVPKTDFDEPLAYQIRVKGHLSPEWADWFGGLVISQGENAETLITGRALDQAALHGLFKKLRDLGLTLISVNPVLPGPLEPNRNQNPSEQGDENERQQ
jgi:hypothetical protein